MLLDRSLITRTSLQDVGRLLRFSESKDWDRFRQYSTMCDPVSLVFLDNINAVWDKKRKIKLPKSLRVVPKRGNLLHRWIALDAIESAGSVSQEFIGDVAIAAARAWVIDPSDCNREDTYAKFMLADCFGFDSNAGAAICAASCAVYATTSASEAARAALWAVNIDANNTINTNHVAYVAAILRIQVLAAIQDYLPEPI